MKTSFPSLLFLFSLACLWSRTLAFAEKDESNLGVRVGLDKVFDPNAYCVADERTKIRSVVRGAMGLTTRKLRDKRQLLKCVELCDESAPGHCFLGHQECLGWRKLEESSAVGGSLAEDFVDSNPDSPILQSVSGGRFLASNMVITPELREQCREASDLVVASLRKELSGLDAPCKRLLRKEVEVECFIL
jgi:hypothetical protein